MKDYTFGMKNKELKNNFILSYEVDEKNNELIVKYANGKEFAITYSIENEKKILEKMKEQVIGVETRLNITKQKGMLFKKTGQLIFSILICSWLIFLPSYSGILKAVVGLLYVVDAVMALDALIHVSKFSKNISDYKKNNFFLEKMEIFQTELTENMGRYINVSRNTNKSLDEFIDISKDNENNEILRPNLNDIDMAKEKALLEIYDMVLKNKDFSTQSNNLVKKKVLTNNNK